MFAKFIHEAEDDICHLFGEIFPKDKWVKVDHLADEHKLALAGNPTFETKGDVPDAPPEPVAVVIAPAA